MTNKELALIRQLAEVAITVAELKAENKILKDINEKLMQALRIHDVVGRSEQCCNKCGSEYYHTYKCINTLCENCIIHD